MPRKPRDQVGTKRQRGGSPPLFPLTKGNLKLLHFCGSIRMTYREAAMRLGVALDTFNEVMQQPEAKAAWEKGEGVSFVSLRSSQFKLAKSNAAMAIHLGKTYLGQKEEVHVQAHVTLEDLVTSSLAKPKDDKE